jgi:hypothetical protein
MDSKKDAIHDFVYQFWLAHRINYGAFDELEIMGLITYININ